MTSEERENLVALRLEKDAVLLRESAKLQERLSFHMVPLYFFRDNAERGNLLSTGSGVLLRLKDRYFILSAGHCVRDAQYGDTAIGIRTSKHRFAPTFVGFSYRKDASNDYGFWEVSRLDAGIIRAGSRVFLSEHSIEVLTSEELRLKNDWMVLSGYPGAITVGDPQEAPSARLLAYSTIISGLDPAPTSRLYPPPTSDYEIDLWVPAVGNIDSLAEEPTRVDVPVLRGASGGGCWRSGVWESPETWTPNKLRLVGVHSGSCDRIEVEDGTEHVFAREYLIANHLRLIAQEDSDMHDFVCERWPQLEAG